MAENRRLCPACLKPLPTDDKRRKWCSQNCRRLVSHWGGPAGYAELKESWSRTWERQAAETGISELARHRNLKRAAEARRCSEMLRAM